MTQEQIDQEVKRICASITALAHAIPDEETSVNAMQQIVEYIESPAGS